MPHYNLPHNHGQNIERVLNKMPSAEGFAQIAFLFQQLDDPTRLRILWLLCHCEECVCNIAAAVDMSAPAVSHHLRILKKSGIISSRRDGKEVYYSLSDTPQEIPSGYPVMFCFVEQYKGNAPLSYVEVRRILLLSSNLFRPGKAHPAALPAWPGSHLI